MPVLNAREQAKARAQLRREIMRGLARLKQSSPVQSIIDVLHDSGVDIEIETEVTYTTRSTGIAKAEEEFLEGMEGIGEEAP